MPSSGSARVERWNRRLHYYLGLYFLFFLWLFLFTGLILNHGRWAWAQAANQRRETRYEQSIRPPLGDTDLARAQDLTNQLHLVGEIDLPSAPQAPARLDFSVARPRDASQVRVDIAQGKASVQHFDNGGWAIVRIFHTFSGSRFNVASTQRDWVLTTVWVAAMDALAVGLILMVLGSYYMWYRLKRIHTLGWIALAAGYGSSVLLLDIF